MELDVIWISSIRSWCFNFNGQESHWIWWMDGFLHVAKNKNSSLNHDYVILTSQEKKEKEPITNPEKFEEAINSQNFSPAPKNLGRRRIQSVDRERSCESSIHGNRWLHFIHSLEIIDRSLGLTLGEAKGLLLSIVFIATGKHFVLSDSNKSDVVQFRRHTPVTIVILLVNHTAIPYL